MKKKWLMLLLIPLIFSLGMCFSNQKVSATHWQHKWTYYMKPHKVRVTKPMLARKVYVWDAMYDAKLTKKRWLHIGQKVTVVSPGTNYAWFLKGKGWGKYGTWVIPAHEKDDWFRVIR